jgi:outer membrane protein assembly factor BamB
MEKGPAFGAQAPPGETDEKAWPTYRGDTERSASTKSALPETLAMLWRSPVAPPARGLLANAWRMRLGSSVSSPVCADGRVYVAATDAGQIVSLDATTGKIVWTASVGGRVDSPPTLYRGLCLVGSHDGWVYALSARDGELAWRIRAAPRERRMVAYGQVESVWPTVGSVLVHEGMAYASAGRTSESDGGVAILAIHPETGKQVWGMCMAPGPQLLNDVLTIRDRTVAWWTVRMSPVTGGTRESEPPATLPKNLTQTGILDGAWTQYKSRRSGNAFFTDSTVASVLAWNSELIFSPTAVVKRASGETLWKPTFPPLHQVEAIALASNAVVYAGRVKADGGEPTGYLTVFSVSDGKTLLYIPLPTGPTFDGLAIADNRVVVSLRDGSVVCLGKNE